MIETARLGHFLTPFFTSSTVSMRGALYALSFAFSRLKGDARLMPLAYLSYAGLLISTLFLADAANLLKHPFWTVIVVLMLVGYLLAPHAIWHLCVGTHSTEHVEVEPVPNKIFNVE